MRDMRSVPFDAGLPRVVRRPKRIVQTIPTGNIRHTSAIRGGTINYEDVFSKKALSQIPVDPDIEREQKLGRGKEVVIDAAEKVRQGREESQARDAKKVRKQTRSKHLLREGEEIRRKGKSDKSRKSNVQKGRSTNDKQAKSLKPEKIKAQNGRKAQKPKVKKYVKRQV